MFRPTPARRHHRRGHRRQHRRGPRAGRRRQGLPPDRCHARQDERRQAGAAAGLWSRSGRHRDQRGARCPRKLQRRGRPPRRRNPRRLPPQPVRQPAQPPNPLPRHGARNLGRFQRAGRSFRGRHGHGRDHLRRRPLPQGTEPPGHDCRRGPGRLDSFRRQPPGLQGRRHRRGFHPQDLQPAGRG